MSSKKKPVKKSGKKPAPKHAKKPHKKPVKIKRVSEESDPVVVEVVSNAVPVVDNGMVIMTPKNEEK